MNIAKAKLVALRIAHSTHAPQAVYVAHNNEARVAEYNNASTLAARCEGYTLLEVFYADVVHP